ncbi:BA14K family protein [Hartmannibacter diazotrophicus]|nr:BA14K family protein [Hartmannibacter diazotrophicus]
MTDERTTDPKAGFFRILNRMATAGLVLVGSMALAAPMVIGTAVAGGIGETNPPVGGFEAHHGPALTRDLLRGGAFSIPTGPAPGDSIAPSAPALPTPKVIFPSTGGDDNQPVIRYRPPPRQFYRPPVSSGTNTIGRDAGGNRAYSPSWYSYCSSRYQTFDPRTGTYMGNDGQRHYCQ